MNGFNPIVETICGWPGALSELMLTTFSVAQDPSVIIKGPMKSGLILLAFCLLVKRTRLLMAKSCVWALRSKYSLLTVTATSKLALIFLCILSCACVSMC
uniref:Uncharacterized protein n=1 Tax=Romanomermis culicivorax TaxID=13658 RepID=A0A915L190_ROMCU